MKTTPDYKPQYSLSIKILSTFMSKSEMKDIMRRYIEAKQQIWKKSIKKK